MSGDLDSKEMNGYIVYLLQIVDDESEEGKAKKRKKL